MDAISSCQFGPPPSATAINTQEPQAPAPTADKTTLLERVQTVVRRHMPIAPLFTPNLKIDLGLFMDDQKLLMEIATRLKPLIGQEDITEEKVLSVLKENGLDKSTLEKFKSDQDRYLSLFCQNCVEALTSLGVSLDITKAIEGRIFTLKNALIGLQRPQDIRGSQKKYAVPPQSPEEIQTNSRNFITQCLRVYLIEQQAPATFSDELTKAANGLIPFLTILTRTYLQENNKECPPDPLRFRNLKGLNHHGLTAATLLEIGLKALGFDAALHFRVDLEPRVTQAPGQAFVLVTAPDGKRYIVDPTATQFHEDLLPGKGEKLPSPILVLPEDQREAYLENEFMRKWREINTALDESQADPQLTKLLQTQDCHLQYTLDPKELGNQLFLGDTLESWVNDSYRRALYGSGYKRAFFNSGIQDILFALNGKPGKTHTLVKGMNLESLVDYKQLKQICAIIEELPEGEEHHKTLIELVAQLPNPLPLRFIKRFKCDQRLNSLIDLALGLNVYSHAVKDCVNPDNRPLRAVYGCAGADATSLFLSSNPTDACLVDLTKASLEDFEMALIQLKTLSQQVPTHQMAAALGLQQFENSRKSSGFSISKSTLEGTQEMPSLPLKLLYDLVFMRALLDTIKISKTNEGAILIEFNWKHETDEAPRTRTITFVTGDITKPDKYPPDLKQFLKGNLDVFFMKAAFVAPKTFHEFLPTIAAQLNPGGFLMTADKTVLMIDYPPDRCLSEAGLSFSTVTTDRIEECKVLLTPPLHPTDAPKSSEQPPREFKIPGVDETYATVITLRRKD